MSYASKCFYYFRLFLLLVSTSRLVCSLLFTTSLFDSSLSDSFRLFSSPLFSTSSRLFFFPYSCLFSFLSWTRTFNFRIASTQFHSHFPFQLIKCYTHLLFVVINIWCLNRTFYSLTFYLIPMLLQLHSILVSFTPFSNELLINYFSSYFYLYLL